MCFMKAKNHKAEKVEVINLKKPNYLLIGNYQEILKNGDPIDIDHNIVTLCFRS